MLDPIFLPGGRYLFDKGRRSVLCADRRGALFVFPNGMTAEIHVMKDVGEYIRLGANKVFAMDETRNF